MKEHRLEKKNGSKYDRQWIQAKDNEWKISKTVTEKDKKKWKETQLKIEKWKEIKKQENR